MRFGTCRECGYFLVAHMHLLDFALPTYCVSQAVEAVADDAVNSLDPDCRESFRELICDFFHILHPLKSVERMRT
jgi:hypothetical protein